MRLLICVKQVLDPETVIGLAADGRWVDPGPRPRFLLNRFDESVIEEAVLLKESRPGSMVDAVTVGPERCRAVLERAMGMGADEGIHVHDPCEGYRPPRFTASRLAEVARRREYDLILAGVMSEDLMQGQVGPMLADMLGRPCATAVMAVRLVDRDRAVVVERELEGRRREELELRLPSLLTLQTGINRPRYPTLSGLLRAKKSGCRVFPAADTDEPEDFETIVSAARPEKIRASLKLEGGSEEKAERLYELLKEKALL